MLCGMALVATCFPFAVTTPESAYCTDVRRAGAVRQSLARASRRSGRARCITRLSSYSMDPTLSGFALGLLLAAAKVGVIGTVGFGIAWWRTRRKLQRLEAALPDPASLAERLANLEQIADYSARQIDQLVESQDALARQLAAQPARPSLPEPR